MNNSVKGVRKWELDSLKKTEPLKVEGLKVTVLVLWGDTAHDLQAMFRAI